MYEGIIDVFKIYVKYFFDWSCFYCEIIVEDSIWDVRDFLVVVIFVFGWQDMLVMFFGISYFFKIMELIFNDWIWMSYDELLVLGFFDFFILLIF